MSNTTRDLASDRLRNSGVRFSGRDVLELGCGTGRNTALIASEARTVFALDFSVGMLSVARARVPATQVSFVRHDVRDSLPLPAACVDVVVVSLVLEHVEELLPVYREVARVLRPGGDLWICELHPERQRLGAQAKFVDPATEEEILVTAYQHTVAEFVNSGLNAGLVLQQLGEWVEPGAAPGTVPRLLSLRFGKL